MDGRTFEPQLLQVSVSAESYLVGSQVLAMTFSGCALLILIGSRKSLTWVHPSASCHSTPTLQNTYYNGRALGFSQDVFKCTELTVVINPPMSSGSGIASGNCTETSCLRVATRYWPGGTSPGSASGNWSTDFGREGWSINFSDRRHSETAMFQVPKGNQWVICHKTGIIARYSS